MPTIVQTEKIEELKAILLAEPTGTVEEIAAYYAEQRELQLEVLTTAIAEGDVL